MWFGLTFLAAIGSGLMAGLLFVFSVTIMSAFGKLPMSSGIAAMQSINTTILNPVFMTAFMGTALLCVVLAIFGVVSWSEPGAAWLIAGAVLYVVGPLLVTMIFNVPLNDTLASVSPDSAEGASLWRNYLDVWTRWNHMRTATSTGALACFMLALRAM